MSLTSLAASFNLILGKATEASSEEIGNADSSVITATKQLCTKANS